MNHSTRYLVNSPIHKSTLGSYLVGAYLFSVPTFSYSGELALNYIPQWLGTIVVLYAVLDIVRTRKFNVPSEIWLYGLFVFWLLVTTLMFGKSQSYDSLLTSVKVGFITLGVTQLIKSDRDFFNALFIYGTSILFVSYLNHETLLYLKSAFTITDMDRFEGTFANANTAAIYAMSVLWIALIFLTRPQTNPIIKIICVVFTTIALYIIYYTGSKKGMLSIALFSLYATWLLFQKYKHSIWKATLVCILGVFIISLTGYYVYSSPFFHRLEVMVELRNTGSTEQRIYLFKTAVAVWLENWVSFLFGIGHDNFRDFNILRTYSHSTISEVLVSSGLIGFLIYFCALGLLFKNLYIQRKRLADSKHFTTIFSCIIFFTLIVFFNMTAVLYSGRELWPMIGCISSYIMFIKRSG